MAAASAIEQRIRIQDICLTIEGIRMALDGTEEEIEDSWLPAIRVRASEATRTTSNIDKRLVARVFDIVIYVESLNHVSKENDQQTFIVAAERWLDVIPDLFGQREHKRLALDNAPLIGVEAVSEMSDGGPVLRQWGTKAFSAIRHTFTVTTQRAQS